VPTKSRWTLPAVWTQRTRPHRLAKPQTVSHSAHRHPQRPEEEHEEFRFKQGGQISSSQVGQISLTKPDVAPSSHVLRKSRTVCRSSWRRYRRPRWAQNVSSCPSSPRYFFRLSRLSLRASASARKRYVASSSATASSCTIPSSQSRTRSCAASHDVTSSALRIFSPRSLPSTWSGHLQRRSCRERCGHFFRWRR